MSDTTIDDALTRLVDAVYVKTIGTGAVPANNPNIIREYAEVKSALYDLILKEVVGEDEPFSLEKEVENSEFDLDARKLEAQNQLRAEQRNKLKELMK